MAAVISDQTIDAALSRVAEIPEGEEENAFRQFAERQPHVLGLLATITEGMGDDVQDLAFDLLFQIDAVFNEERRATYPTLPVEAVERGYEAAIAAAEHELGMPEADLLRRIVQPNVMRLVTEALSEPLIDDDGEEVTVPPDDLAELVLAFRSVVETYDKA